jgi:hypothetical protein
MMNFETWKSFNESLAGNVNLGVSKPHAIGKIFGLHQEWDDEDEDEDEDEENDGQEGDLIGSSDEDEGPDKDFPPENSEDDEEVPFDNDDPSVGASEFGEPEDDDFLSSIGSGGDGMDMEDPNFFAPGEDEMPAEEPVDMDFLGDISADLLGKEFGGDEPFDAGSEVGAELGGEEFGSEFGDSEVGAELGGEPCPDCNPHGEDVGDPDCETCAGEGFMNDLGEEPDFDPSMSDSEEMVQSDKMLSYMKKYMKKEAAQLYEVAPALAVAARAAMPAAQAAMPAMQSTMAPMAQRMAGQFAQGAGAQAANNLMNPQQQQQQQMMRKKMVKFMTKGGERSFMAADAPRKFMKKDGSKQSKVCHTEQNEFLNSLRSSAKGNHYKNFDGLKREDALFQPAEPRHEPEAGQRGFAPQGRVGSIGGGYTQQDVNDIPVLGESHRYPTLAEYAAFKHRKAQAKKSRR